MKKILIALSVLVIAVIAVLYFSLNAVIKYGVETLGSKATGTSVQLSSASILPFSGKGSMSGLSIANPEGFAEGKAFSMNEIRLELDVHSLFSDTIAIEEIFIDAPHVSYEASGRTDNIKTLMNNVKESSKKSKADAQKKTSDKPAEKQKNVEISDVIIKSGKVDISVTALKGERISVDLPDIHIKDIGKDGKTVTLDEAMAIIFEALSKNVGISVADSAKIIQKKVQEKVEKAVGGTVEETTDKLKGMFGK